MFEIRKRLIFTLFLLLALINTAFCIQPSSRENLTELIRQPAPVVVAHGKNVNIAEESTWRNILCSIKNGAQVLEFDVQILKQYNKSDPEQFIVLHDPTFHKLVKNYSTPQEKVNRFIAENPAKAKSKEWAWDFNLFDRMSTFSLNEIKSNLMLYDKKTEVHFELITLDETLSAIGTPGKFRIPAHRCMKDGKEGILPSSVIPLTKPIFYYLDVKDLNALARRLNNLPTWDWDRNWMTTDEQIAFTARVFKGLSDTLKAHRAHEKVFLCVRHEKVAEIARKIDPKIKIMASTENANINTRPADLIRELEKFSAFKPEFYEIKYLNHILSPEIRYFIQNQKSQAFYNKITQTDPGQFEGRYKDNLPLLLQTIMETGRDVFIQTNTVPEVVQYLH
ncbi:MAG: hypothetical protein HQM10_23200 [Candidatus Riflebacteria bacterium]|nr:hypothetical protein [Candidatus Riflebacteria bacterium]